MPTKEQLLQKLTDHARSKNFTKQDLDSLMQKCGCRKYQGGRGSGIRYASPDHRTLCFDLPHPQKELLRYQIRMTIEFLRDIGEL